MAKNQKSYTPEFKQQIVDLHCKVGKGVTELSNEYGIPKGTVSMWIKNLSPVQVEQLFDRFYTVEIAHNSTGLGLSIARTLIERLNGKITAEYNDSKLSIRIKFN